MTPDYDKKVPDNGKMVPESKNDPGSDKKYLKKAGGTMAETLYR